MTPHHDHHGIHPEVVSGARLGGTTGSQALRQLGHYRLECEAMLRQGDGHCGVTSPRLCLPLNAATHEVSIHSGHGDANTLALELTAMIAGVAVPAPAHRERHGFSLKPSAHMSCKTLSAMH